jgi:two-component system sensor histidine kinase KdpD
VSSRSRFAISTAGYVVASGSVALVTALIAVAASVMRIANLEMLYLLAVLGVATLFGVGPAIAAALLAFLAFDFFFVEPIHTFTVADPNEWISLLLLLVTAILVGGLAAELGRRASQARRREREAVALHALAEMILTEPDPVRALPRLADRLRQELIADGVAILLEEPDGRLEPRATAGHVEPFTRDERAIAEQVHASGEPIGLGHADARARIRGRVHMLDRAGHRAFLPLRVGERRFGVLRVARSRSVGRLSTEEERLVASAAAQIGLMLERARLRDEATRAEALRQSDELKSALLSSVSHDLRTPLASIKALAGSLLQADVDWTDEEWRAFVGTIERESDRLNRIVDNLLDLSRIEAGTLHPRKELYALGALVDDVLVRLAGQTADHRVTVDVPDDLPPVPLDRVQVDQVLTNLVENAVRHTPVGTRIRVSAMQVGDAVRVTVEDEGVGIPPAALPRVFDKFYRGDRGADARRRGTGLGLAVVRGLVEAHGGRVWAESNPGRGAAFHVVLPLEPARIALKA